MFFIIFIGLAFLSDAMEMMILSILAPALHCHWQISQVQQASLTTVVFLGEKMICVLLNYFLLRGHLQTMWTVFSVFLTPL